MWRSFYKPPSAFIKISYITRQAAIDQWNK
uniref:Uncharacterized protein n=1 Tax=Rhizophora mucronata TaxID=61149 RepID=A0A2P2QWR0_RHIMU